MKTSSVTFCILCIDMAGYEYSIFTGQLSTDLFYKSNLQYCLCYMEKYQIQFHQDLNGRQLNVQSLQAILV